jgi:pimeloyl-ACP methyl ester carboxylesterase
MDAYLREERYPTDAVTLNAVVGGRKNAPLIVFLHGVLRRWQTFTRLYTGLSPAHEARAFAAAARDVTRITFRGAGHSLHIDRTQDVLKQRFNS